METVEHYFPASATALSENSSERESFRGAQARILHDLKEIENDNMLFFEVNISDDSIFKWDVTFPAPNGQAVKAEVQFDSQYPFIPPKMFIKQKLFHPNISAKNGEVCLQNLKEYWSSTSSVWTLILSTQALLSDPNPYDPANINAANLLLHYPEEYHKVASTYFNSLDCYEDRDSGYSAILQNDEDNSEKKEFDDEIILQIALHDDILGNNRK